jgi:hypothetical protein
MRIVLLLVANINGLVITCTVSTSNPLADACEHRVVQFHILLSKPNSALALCAP